MSWSKSLRMVPSRFAYITPRLRIVKHFSDFFGGDAEHRHGQGQKRFLPDGTRLGAGSREHPPGSCGYVGKTLKKSLRLARASFQERSSHPPRNCLQCLSEV